MILYSLRHVWFLLLYRDSIFHDTFFPHSLLLLSKTDQFPLNVSVGLKKFNPNFPIYINPPTCKGNTLLMSNVI